VEPNNVLDYRKQMF